MRKANFLRSRNADRLREQILLSLFYDNSAHTESNKLTLPRHQDIRRYEKARKSLKIAFTVLGIDEAQVDSSIDPFFSNVIGLATALSKKGAVQEITRTVRENEGDNPIYSWMITKPQLSLIERVEDFVNKFNDNEFQIFSHINKYLAIMNSFLADSKKTLSFKDDSSLLVTLPSKSPADVYFLSSGERQLFVLITTLMFSDEINRADAVIIDEPELSLHLKWQEMFVESLLEANPSIQLILATHSPSIIVDRDSACVDLS